MSETHGLSPRVIKVEVLYCNAANITCLAGERLKIGHGFPETTAHLRLRPVISARLLDWVALLDRLQAADRPSLQAHFLSLDAEDRRLRFGAESDRHIVAYVDGIHFDASHVYGVRGRGGQWLGIGHLSQGDGVAELGLSVLPEGRGKGLGAAIFRYAVAQASRHGASRLYMHCLASNRAILSIARSAGMSIGSSGGESDAYLVVPDRAELIDGLVGEAVDLATGT